MERDDQVKTTATQVLEESGHRNVVVTTVKLGEGGPGAASGEQSAGIWAASSDQGTISFWLTWNEYNNLSVEVIKTAIARQTQ
jgi:hypothetical protein